MILSERSSRKSFGFDFGRSGLAIGAVGGAVAGWGGQFVHQMEFELCEPWYKKIAHAHHVAAGEGRQRRELDLLATQHLRASEQADVLRPAEGLLNALACFHARGVFGMSALSSRSRFLLRVE